MAGHQWHPLHGDMPVQDMNDNAKPHAVEGEMPTRPMNAAPPPARNLAQATDQVDAELAMYLERKESGHSA